MPRSNLNWASRARAMYIDDALAGAGYINRKMLVDYFGIEKSLGSMDITAYGLRAPIRKASAGELIDGDALAGYKLGGKAWYVPAAGWASVTGSTAERRAVWGLLPHATSGGARGWFSSVMTAWREDHPHANAENAMAFFGIGRNEADALIDIFTGNSPKAERAKVWEYFK